MRVINTAINVTQSNEDDSRERTILEIFAQFNHKLKALSLDQTYQETLKNIDKLKD